MPLRHPALIAAPGVVALALAVVALTDDGGGTERVRVVEEAPPAAAQVPGFAELYELVSGSVARIDARRGPEDPPFDTGRRIATGAAFLYDEEGHLVTNAHVVERARSATVRFGRSQTRIRARIVGRDRSTDLAVVKIDPDRLRDQRPLRLAAAESIEVGEPVLAVGTPYRLQSSAAAGIVSALGRQIPGSGGFTIPDAIQTDTAINPGNSGGPLVDERGQVVGVNTQGRAPGVSFAVSSTTIERIVPQLIEDGRARNAYLGVSVDERGRVTAVTDGGPAERAGIRTGDVIRSLGGRPTGGEGEVASAIAAHRPGERVEVELRRRTITVRLGEQPRRPAEG